MSGLSRKKNQAKTQKKIPNVLLDYSNWLESKGIVVKDIINGEKRRQVLLQAFIRKVRKSNNFLKKSFI